jgi:hypothetical protein
LVLAKAIKKASGKILNPPPPNQSNTIKAGEKVLWKFTALLWSKWNGNPPAIGAGQKSF